MVSRLDPNISEDQLRRMARWDKIKTRGSIFLLSLGLGVLIGWVLHVAKIF